VGAYGSTRGATPTLDRLAREGLRFDVAYAHVPMTLPSHTTIMTGTLPLTNGVRDNGSFRFDGRRPTLAGVLTAAGYETGARRRYHGSRHQQPTGVTRAHAASRTRCRAHNPAWCASIGHVVSGPVRSRGGRGRRNARLHRPDLVPHVGPAADRPERRTVQGLERLGARRRRPGAPSCRVFVPAIADRLRAV